VKDIGYDGKPPRAMVIPDDLPALEQQLQELGATVLIVDPLSAFLSDETKSHNEHSVRRMLTPLAQMAERLKLTVIVVRHLVKAPQGSAIAAGGGSIAFIGVARSALVAAVDPEDENAVVLAVVKCNLAKKPPSLRYRIVEAPDGSSHVEWRGESTHTADSLLDASRDTDERGALDEATQWLGDFLRTHGATPKPVIAKAAHEEARISARTLDRAAGRVGVERSNRAGFGGAVVWQLADAGRVSRHGNGAQPNVLANGATEGPTGPNALNGNGSAVSPHGLAQLDGPPAKPGMAKPAPRPPEFF